MEVVQNNTATLGGNVWDLSVTPAKPKTSGTIYAVVQLNKPGDASDGKYWDTNAGGSWQASPTTWPTATYKNGSWWTYAVPAGATNGMAGGVVVLADLTDNVATPASSTVSAGGMQQVEVVSALHAQTDSFTIPTAAAIADQVWDETLADHVASGSTGEALSIASPSGAYQATISVTVSSLPVADVSVSVYDSSNTGLIGRKLTTAAGTAVFALDAATYKIRLSKAGVSFTIPETIVVTANETFTLTGTLAAAASSALSTYERRRLRRPKIRYNNTNDDNPLTFQLIKDGAKIEPTSATIQILNPSGTQIVAATASGVSISGTLITYAVLTTTTASYPVAQGYRAHWIITASSITYEEDQIFDVCKLVPFGRIGKDQLLAIDDRIKGMEHAGDEDFSELINSCQDIAQFKLETKATADGQLTEDMILDQTRAAIPVCMLVLSRIFQEKGYQEDAKYYEAQYNELMDALLAAVRYDKNQDLAEDGTLGSVVPTKLVM